MLTVYRASAGSGKTFTLAVEYIKLLVSNPQAYRQTLAVTFTNKATEEMKMRILSQLYGIWRLLPESAGYTDKVCSELGVTPQHAAAQAGKALTLLLHNYSQFRVETIDSFFQSVLRNLARELELTANLHVGLNDAQVEEQAVDQMIDSLQRTDKMLSWVLGYIMDSIGEDRSWNVIGQIKTFGKTIFRDCYKQESRKLNMVIGQEGFIDDYAHTLQAVRAQAKRQMTAIADTFFNTIDGEGLTTDDFAGKSRGVCSIFIKMRRGEMDEGIVTKTVAEAVDNPAAWYAKSSSHRELIHTLADGPLGELLRQALDERPRQWKMYKSADLTLRHLSQLRLLNSIERRVRQMNEEANRFLLSDTQQLLHDIIDGSDSPFIFEKTGTQLEHIMIDEFQDTSTVQWQNFKVLLHEVLSHKEGSALIVGDVKQSIYRWRSGDWRLLAGITEEFAQDGGSGGQQRVEVRQLDTNYRSAPRVVRFNNTFFAEAARQEGVQAYGDVEQKWPAGAKETAGTVEVCLFPPDDYVQTTLDAVAQRIERLLADGAHPTDIAVLVRNNAHIPILANHLLQALPGVEVVSDEAFRLDASPAVQLIIAALRHIANRNDSISRAFLAKSAAGSIDGQLPEDYEACIDELSRMPLYDLTEQIYAIFNSRATHQEHSAYLCAFFDHVAEYVSDSNVGIDDFLRHWDDTLCSATIQSPEMNGVRIISIHKSKGLEFPHVIIPFCDWRLEHSDILWCRPQESPFSRLPLAPVDYSAKGMRGTIYERDYDEERQQTLVDNLNLLYVAFTRASQHLHVFGRRGAAATRSALIEQVLPQLSLEGATLRGVEDEKATLHFKYGSLQRTHNGGETLARRHNTEETTQERGDGKGETAPAGDNPFLRKSEPVAVEIGVHRQKVFLGQSNRSARFAAGDDGAENEGYVQLGSVLHEVLANIRTTDDIDRALTALQQEGVIYDRDITPQRLQQLIRRRVGDARVAEWFSDRWTLYNECSILLPDGETRRPDRVMTDGRETIVVDFKFGNERDEYHDQVREYISLLKEMGMPGVKGCLWFVYSNKIVEVRE